MDKCRRTVSSGIAIQGVPEGLVIIAPLLLAGVSRLRTLVIAISIGILEVTGVWAGFGLGSISVLLLPMMLGFAGGAMPYVTSDEMIPETGDIRASAGICLNGYYG